MSEASRKGNTKTLKEYEAFETKLKRLLRNDPRYSVLDFQRGKNVLHIFADSIPNVVRISRAYRTMSAKLLSTGDARFKIKVVLLPDKSVARLVRGICHVGVAPVRSSAASSSEQVTQVLYGESFDTLQILGGWTRIRLHADRYIGWVSSDQVTLFTAGEFDSYQSPPEAFAAERVLDLFQKPNAHSLPVREAVFGSRLKLVGQDGDFLKVSLPDGEMAYAKKTSVSFISPVRKFSIKNLLTTALTFLGVSYLWGGRSSKGFDCSGFVQTVFRLNGIELPRDTTDQFSSGRFAGRDIRRLRPGDLLFFSSNGDKISHVALYTGRNRRVHSLIRICQGQQP